MYPKDNTSNWFSGQGNYQHVSPREWNNWVWQLHNRVRTIEELKSRLNLSEEEERGCESAKHKLHFAITPHFFNLIDPDDVNCPIRKQVIPTERETFVAPDEMLDPIGEEHQMPVRGLVHRYPDRVLFLVTNHCGSYCRYCTRSRLVSNAQAYDFHPAFDDAIAYIEKNTCIRDVLISGGDPLLLPNRVLKTLLKRLRAIDHVEFIRVGSRLPVFMPQRITPELCAIFKEVGPIWLSIHVNHPRECTLELKRACRDLSLSHVILANQSVLLQGVNDSVETMRSLCHRLLQMGVRPYYIYQCDLITGSSHFRTPFAKGLEIIEGLRGHTTGYAVPQLVIDLPGGGGKVPVNPQTIKEITENEVFLVNYQKQEFCYPLKPAVRPPKTSEECHVLCR